MEIHQLRYFVAVAEKSASDASATAGMNMNAETIMASVPSVAECLKHSSLILSQELCG
jgi:hypothetical protein